LDSSVHFEGMFESIIDIFEEGNNISFKKILTKYLPGNKAHVSHATGESEWYTPLAKMKNLGELPKWIGK